jgi:hypothetical protein
MYLLLDGYPMTFNAPTNTASPYLPTTMFIPDDFEEFRVKFMAAYTNIANTINARQIALFDLVETLSGEQWFIAGNTQQKRQTFRKVFNIGSIATGATLNTAHGLTGVVAYTHIYGTCVTDAPDFKPIPYVSATTLNTQISIRVDATNIIIVNGAGAANITSALVILEYLKN